MENQKDRLLDETIRAAEKIKSPHATVEALRRAQGERQFQKAVEMVKSAIPDSLLIDGHHNPLALLHSALSEGLHEAPDDVCLELATSIRLVLEELAERAAAALKDHVELQHAVTRLSRKQRS
ncbi:MAG: hypothetical protein ACREL5_05640 [Gemmatimonadales bacterium]